MEFRWESTVNIEPANTTFRRYKGIVPNPKLRLREQLNEVMRFKQFSLRTKGAGQGFHPCVPDAGEVVGFLNHLVEMDSVAVSAQNQALMCLLLGLGRRETNRSVICLIYGLDAE